MNKGVVGHITDKNDSSLINTKTQALFFWWTNDLNIISLQCCVPSHLVTVKLQLLVLPLCSSWSPLSSPQPCGHHMCPVTSISFICQTLKAPSLFDSSFFGTLMENSFPFCSFFSLRSHQHGDGCGQPPCVAQLGLQQRAKFNWSWQKKKWKCQFTTVKNIKYKFRGKLKSQKERLLIAKLLKGKLYAQDRNVQKINESVKSSHISSYCCLNSIGFLLALLS